MTSSIQRIHHYCCTKMAACSDIVKLAIERTMLKTPLHSSRANKLRQQGKIYLRKLSDSKMSFKDHL